MRARFLHNLNNIKILRGRQVLCDGDILVRQQDNTRWMIVARPFGQYGMRYNYYLTPVKNPVLMPLLAYLQTGTFYNERTKQLIVPAKVVRAFPI